VHPLPVDADRPTPLRRHRRSRSSHHGRHGSNAASSSRVARRQIARIPAQSSGCAPRGGPSAPVCVTLSGSPQRGSPAHRRTRDRRRSDGDAPTPRRAPGECGAPGARRGSGR
jgi:hypothetical protein